MHLIIAEKNLSAQRIAQILAGKGGARVKKEGGVPVYLFDDTTVTGLKGHVVEIDFLPEYGDWRSPEYRPRSLIDAPTRKSVTEKRIVQLIQKLGKRAELVTIATDYDTEGELIGKEALELIREVNPAVQVRRARFSSITPQEIRAAFENPGSIDLALASAGEARQLIDLVWGASLTRFISIAARRGGSHILSVGRVQSPTLAMIVDREREIESFVPEKYWTLSCLTEKGGREFRAEHARGRFRDRKSAEAAKAGTLPPLVVEEVKAAEKVERPPAPFDTTAFIVSASRLGFGAARAMQLAEELYMNGLISYPRTDNTVYPGSLNLRGILGMLASTEFAGDAAWVAENARTAPTRGKKQSTDHPPIHPTGAARREEIGEERYRLYELVVRRFLATLSPDARWATVRAQLRAGSEPYHAAGSRLVEPGWRRVYPYGEAKENVLPPLVQGESLPLLEVAMEEKETQPPPRYTQSRLIQRMEELGLGTKSTRHEVIQKLISRRYVFGNPLRPTLVGRAVIEALEDFAGTITKPEMTRVLEEHMQQIKEEKRTQKDVVLESRQMLHRVFDELEAHEKEIGMEIVRRTAEEQAIGLCPACGGKLSIRQTRGKGQFIGCSNFPKCTLNINLPGMEWGRAVRTEGTCREHGLYHIRLVRKGARPWEIGCPLCSHIASQREALRLIPSLDDSLIARLHAACIFTVNEIAGSTPARITEVTGIGQSEAEELVRQAGEALGLLRRRSELRKFVRARIAPRKGRSRAEIMEKLFAAGIDDLRALAQAEPGQLRNAGLSQAEAEKLAADARALCSEKELLRIGIPAASLKKYIAAGCAKPEDLCRQHPAALALMTGLSPETVWKHLSLVCRAIGREAPPKITKAAVERGRREFLAIRGMDAELLEKLFSAGIMSIEALRGSAPEELSLKTGLPPERIRELILSSQMQ